MDTRRSTREACETCCGRGWRISKRSAWVQPLGGEWVAYRYRDNACARYDWFATQADAVQWAEQWTDNIKVDT
jgi:hypothetical protein